MRKSDRWALLYFIGGLVFLIAGTAQLFLKQAWYVQINIHTCIFLFDALVSALYMITAIHHFTKE